MGNSNDHSSNSANANHEKKNHNHHMFHFHHHNHNNDKKQIAPEIETLFKWIRDQNDNHIDHSLIKAYFSSSSLFDLILTNKSIIKSQLDELKAKVFMSELMQLFSVSSMFEYYIDAIFSDDTITYETVVDIFENCLYFTLKCVGFYQVELSQYSKNTLKYIVDSMIFVTNEKNEKVVTKNEFKNWVINEFPQLFYGFHNWFLKRVKDLSNDDISKQDNPYKTSEDLSMFMNDAAAWYLVSNLPGLYVKHLASENGTVLERLKNCIYNRSWSQLYVSENHGLSLNRFQSCLFNYKAPTIMFIYCSSGNLYCICNNDEYKESPVAYGDDQVRVYKFWTAFKIYDLSSTKNIYLNTKSKGLKLGLIIGYSQTKQILKIDEDLHKVEHESNLNDTIVSVEVWGCGPSKALQDQLGVKKWEAKQIEKMRTVKIDPSDWKSNADKALLELGGVKTEHSERGDM